MICPNCGAQLPDTVQACWSCGYVLNQGGNVSHNNMPNNIPNNSMPYNNAQNNNPYSNVQNNMPNNIPNNTSYNNVPNNAPYNNISNSNVPYNNVNPMNPQPMYNYNNQAPKQDKGLKTIIIVLSVVFAVAVILGFAIWMINRQKKNDKSSEQAGNMVTTKTEDSTTEKTEDVTTEKTESGNKFADEKVNDYTMGSMTYSVPDRYLGDGIPNEEGYVYFYYEDVMVMVSKETATVDIKNQIMQDSIVEGFFAELGEPTDVEKIRDIKVDGQDAFEFTGKVEYAGEAMCIDAYIIQCAGTWYEVVYKDNTSLDNKADFDNLIDSIEFSED